MCLAAKGINLALSGPGMLGSYPHTLGQQQIYNSWPGTPTPSAAQLLQETIQCGVIQTVQEGNGNVSTPSRDEPTPLWCHYAEIHFNQTLFCIWILPPSWRFPVKVKVNAGVTCAGGRLPRSTDNGIIPPIKLIG